MIFHVVGPRGAVPRIDPTMPVGRVQLARLHRYERESYGDFLWQLVGHGSLGRSVLFGDDLTEPSFEPAPVTFSLVGGAVIFGLLVGVPLGLLWARKRGARFAAAPFTHLALAALPLWVGLWLGWFFAYKESLLPIAQYCNLFSPSHGCGGPVDWANHLVLPSATLGLALAAVYAGVTRRLMVSVARAVDDRAKARRRALIAFGKLLSRNVSWLIGATLFVESIFGIPGFGRAVFGALLNGDTPYAESLLVVAALLAVGFSLTVDLLAGALLPDWRINEF